MQGNTVLFSFTEVLVPSVQFVQEASRLVTGFERLETTYIIWRVLLVPPAIDNFQPVKNSPSMKTVSSVKPTTWKLLTGALLLLMVYNFYVKEKISWNIISLM